LDEIISQLFIARDIAHSLHLRSKSFAKHIALNDFYEEIVDIADEIAETYQGQHGLLTVDVKKYPPAFPDNDPLLFIKGIADWAQSTRPKLNQADTFTINLWDELLALINRTKYKLENLA